MNADYYGNRVKEFNFMVVVEGNLKDSLCIEVNVKLMTFFIKINLFVLIWDRTEWRMFRMFRIWTFLKCENYTEFSILFVLFPISIE